MHRSKKTVKECDQGKFKDRISGLFVLCNCHYSIDIITGKPGSVNDVIVRREQDHEVCVSALKKIKRPLLSTWMPVTEAMYLLDASVEAQNALLEMIERGFLKILEIGASDLPAIRALINKYNDQPMDFEGSPLGSHITTNSS